MILEAPYYEQFEVPDTDKIELRIFNGKKYLILNRENFIEYNQNNFKDFCFKTSYHSTIDMYPDNIYREAVHSDESYLAYMYACQREWQNVAKLEEYIKGLNELINFVKFG